MNEIIESLISRKSVRSFTNQEISKDDKKLIIRCALEAPTGGNQMPYSILDITDPKVLQALSESCDHQPFIATAKMCLIFCVDLTKWDGALKSIGLNPKKPGPGSLLLSSSDAFIAAQNTVVAAWSLGIGSCYIGDILEQYEFHKELLGLPATVVPVAMLVFGYPTPQQKDRKKPARFAPEYVVFENKYKSLNQDELKAMFTQRGEKDNLDYNYQDWLTAFFKRKYDVDFAREMQRSVKKYFEEFDGD
ncbi:MAG: nitroreductase family protein [Erysipelotrichaceae bacterium]|jgi:nitroreductase/FMN reductase (NADPH)/FMN reductase [NAD(P)H]|nr:nitroreductase family protein [Erysipelotrichaceae bacterium]